MMSKLSVFATTFLLLLQFSSLVRQARGQLAQPQLCSTRDCCRTCCSSANSLPQFSGGGFSQSNCFIACDNDFVGGEGQCSSQFAYQGVDQESCTAGVSFRDPEIKTFGYEVVGHAPAVMCCLAEQTLLLDDEALASCRTTNTPTNTPSTRPTKQPTKKPTVSPTFVPTHLPTISPTALPTHSLTASPSRSPIAQPTHSPTGSPTKSPIAGPTHSPTASPSRSPIAQPIHSPTGSPTKSPIAGPTASPMQSPTGSSTGSSTGSPTTSPTASPTRFVSEITPTADTSVPTVAPDTSTTSAPSPSQPSTPSTQTTVAPTATQASSSSEVNWMMWLPFLLGGCLLLVSVLAVGFIYRRRSVQKSNYEVVFSVGSGSIEQESFFTADRLGPSGESLRNGSRQRKRSSSFMATPKMETLGADAYINKGSPSRLQRELPQILYYRSQKFQPREISL